LESSRFLDADGEEQADDLGCVFVPTYQYRCAKPFQSTETITEHGTAKVQCVHYDSKK
jgi:hypothetical protein